MRILPGLGVFWRDQDTVQIGLDPRAGAIIEGLTRGEQEFVSLLTSERTAAELDPMAQEHGISSTRAAEILTMLSHAGVLQGANSLPGSAEKTERHVIAPVSPLVQKKRPTRRSHQHVHIERLDALGTTIALKLAENGIRHMSFGDTHLVTHHDHPLLWPRWEGLPRSQAIPTLLRQVSPSVRVCESDAPDLVVVTGSRFINPNATAAWMDNGYPHLLAWDEEIDTCVGPIVEPGHSACACCLYEHSLAADHAWAVLAAQAEAVAALPSTSDTRDLAASVATRAILAFLDGSGNSLHNAQWRVPPLPAFPRLISVEPHPACGCTSYEAMVAALTSSLPKDPLRAVKR